MGGGWAERDESRIHTGFGDGGIYCAGGEWAAVAMAENRGVEMKTFLLYILAFVATVCVAQPQAPVVWGAARWLGTGCNFMDRNQIAHTGDTLLLGGMATDHSGSRTAFSLDDGNTWSAWQNHDSLEDVVDGSMSVYADAGRTFITYTSLISHSDTPYYLVRRSVDGGATWQTTIPQHNNYSLLSGATAGDDVILVTVRWTDDAHADKRAVVSHDRGDHWRIGVPISNDSMRADAVTITRDHFFLSGFWWLPDDNPYYYTARCRRTDTTWSAFEEIPGQPFAPVVMGSSLAGDTTSGTAILMVTGLPRQGSGRNLIAVRTTNCGVNWMPPVSLTDDAPLRLLSNAEVFCDGKRWGIAWEDQVRQGLYWRFSANGGADWYPAQRVDDFSIGTITTEGFFDGNEVKLFWDGSPSHGVGDYRTATGTIHPDTTGPSLEFGLRFRRR